MVWTNDGTVFATKCKKCDSRYMVQYRGKAYENIKDMPVSKKLKKVLPCMFCGGECELASGAAGDMSSAVDSCKFIFKHPSLD